MSEHHGDNTYTGKVDPFAPGRRFGRLMVVQDVAPHTTPSGRTFRRVLCACDCGGDKVTRTNRLRSGETVSCGCRTREIRAAIAEGRKTPEGQAPTYHAAHARIRRQKGSANTHPCVDCGRTDRRREWSYLGGCPDELMGGDEDERRQPMAYCLHVEHYQSRCKQDCHGALDHGGAVSVRRLRGIVLANTDNDPERRRQDA